MKWYYVENGDQAGPVEEAELGSLLQSGKLTGSTLVWHEGMANWEPFSSVAPPAYAASVNAPPVLAGGAGPSATEAVCAECGGVFNRDEMIRHGDAFICARCKPVFIQKLSEGMFTGVRRGRRTLPVNADELVAEITARGFEVNIGDCVSRGWNLVKANFWLCVGATCLVMLCNQAAGFLPFVGIILSLMVQGPLMGGLNNFYLKLIRGDEANIGDAFSGFTKAFWRLCGTFLLMVVAIYIWLVPVVAVAVIQANRNAAAPGVAFWLLLSLGFVALVYVAVAFMFALPLCADLGLGPWDSLRTSWRVAHKRWFTLFGLVLVSGLLAALGLLACFIGILFTLPLFYAATLYAYEDIFGLTPATDGQRA